MAARLYYSWAHDEYSECVSRLEQSDVLLTLLPKSYHCKEFGTMCVFELFVQLLYLRYLGIIARCEYNTGPMKGTIHNFYCLTQEYL